jgi:hypothetical protein
MTEPETEPGPVVAHGRVDYGAVVLSRILPHRLEDLEYAAERLGIDHFADGRQRSMWHVLYNYWARYREVFPSAYLVDLLTSAGVEPATVLVMSNLYDAYVKAEPTEGQFRAAVDRLCDSLNSFQTRTTLERAYDILENGVGDGDDRLVGHADARDFVLGQFAEIAERDTDDEAPEGDIRAEADRLVAAYDNVHGADPDQLRGVEFGIGHLDSQTNGVQPGELCLIAGYASEGKSQICAQMAWHTAVIQQRGVFFATTETIRDTTIRRILARHSRQAKFGLVDGLNARTILNGRLTEPERRTYFDVIEDFASTAAMCHISQMPARATVDFVAARATRINRASRLDLILIDYLQLFEVPGRSMGEREDYNRILRGAKRLAATFDAGRGVAVVSPWQMNKEAYKVALEAQSYTLASLADTSEAEKSPDLVIPLLMPPDQSRIAIMQGLKCRDAAKIPPFEIEVDYRNSFLGDRNADRADRGTLPQSDRRAITFEILGDD